MDKKTPLYEEHIKAGGRMVSFANFLLPVQYETGIIKEHMAVRTGAGLFDVSHMGEIIIKGNYSDIQKIITRDISSLEVNHIAYSPICLENGGVVDDVLIYKKSEDEYLLVVNASNTEKDLAHIKKHLQNDVVNISQDVAQLALQGPLCEKILSKLTKDIPSKYYTFIDNALICGTKALISRTGYTGEDGFEIYCPNSHAAIIWQELLKQGATPCGLGARDTLRLEAAMPLYGSEMDESILPYEAGIGFFVNADTADFIGKDELLKKKEFSKKRVGLTLIDRGIARAHTKVFFEGKEVGEVTSGTHSPYLKIPIAMARVEKSLKIGDIVELRIRDKILKAEVVKLPFYSRKK